MSAAALNSAAASLNAAASSGSSANAALTVYVRFQSAAVAAAAASGALSTQIRLNGTLLGTASASALFTYTIEEDSQVYLFTIPLELSVLLPATENVVSGDVSVYAEAA